MEIPDGHFAGSGGGLREPDGLRRSAGGRGCRLDSGDVGCLDGRCRGRGGRAGGSVLTVGIEASMNGPASAADGSRGVPKTIGGSPATVGIAGTGGIGTAGGSGGGTSISASCTVEAIPSARAVGIVTMLCVSGPSSPGLRTRTEIEMLHPEHAPRSGGDAAPEPQLQFQFQTHSDDEDGVIELVPNESSAQFQFQFHTQFTGAAEPKSGRVIGGAVVELGDIVCVELVLLVLPA